MKGLLTEWARLLVHSLAEAGIRDAVVSPGSRSTPLVVAVQRHPDLNLHSIIDERSAAFFALGQARMTGRPSVLICTSGTAGAHYFPAIIEASLSFLPLLVLTADRPGELSQSGAAQTIDQVKLFGDKVREFFELGLPDSHPDALFGLRRKVAQAVSCTQGPLPGVVHMNFRARKPLEETTLPSELDLKTRFVQARARPLAKVVRAELGMSEAAADALRQQCLRAERGLIVCGPAHIQQVLSRPALFALARRTGFPMLAEASSQLRLVGDDLPDGVTLVDNFDALLKNASFRSAHRPDLILQFGHFPVSKGFEDYLIEHSDCTRLVIAPHGWLDPQNQAQARICVSPCEAASSILARLPVDAPVNEAWALSFREANARVHLELTDALETPGALSEARVVRDTLRATAQDSSPSWVFVGNSLAIRHLEMVGYYDLGDVRVITQRGANGIDGLVSGAAGAASKGMGRLSLLLGDVSLLHDLSALGLLAKGKIPVTVVVINNNGGRIFDQLPVAGQLVSEALSPWTTPHGFTFEAAANLFGLAFAEAATPQALSEALARAHAEPHSFLIEARVDPENAKSFSAALRQRVEGSLLEKKEFRYE